jgi:outer membrane protein assembly factor BamB
MNAHFCAVVATILLGWGLSPAVAAPAEVSRAHATAVAAVAAQTPGEDFVISLPDFLDYQPQAALAAVRPATITVKLRRRGDRWLPGTATGWTGGEHTADASGLRWEQGQLTGTLRLRFDPRGERTQTILGRPLNNDMLPPQTAPFTLDVVVALKATEPGKLAGTGRRAPQLGFPEFWNEVSATVRSSAEPLPAAEGLAATWRQLVGIEEMQATGARWDEVAPHVPDWASTGGEKELAARAAAALAETAGSVPVGPGGCEDPDFGPWWAAEALPDNVVSDQPGWRYVGRWQVVTALPTKLDRRAPAVSLAPVLVDGRAPLRDGAGKEHAWRSVGPATGRGQQRQSFGNIWQAAPPPWIDPQLDEQRGFDHVRKEEKGDFLAVADVESPASGPVWLGTAKFAHGSPVRLYLNERLVWQTPVVDEPTNTRGAVLRVVLRKGTNRLLIHGTTSTYNQTANPFLVAFCARGEPRPAAVVAAAHAQQRAAIEKAEAARRHLRGYQTDWRGQHPDADPVRAWDLATGKNVLWRCRLPSSPGSESLNDAANVVVVGRKVFATGSPHLLYCLDADTGKVLWQRVTSPFEVLEPALLEESERLRLAAEKAQLTVRDGLGEAQKAKLDADTAAWNALLDRLGDGDGVKGRRPNWFGFPWWHSPSWAAPVSDGKHIWVKFGVGVAACYDLDGNRRWIVRTGNAIVGERCAPVLVDGLLVLQLPRQIAGKPGAVSDQLLTNAGTNFLFPGDLRNYELVALDAATGAERWRTPVMAGGNEGSPIVAHAAKGDEVLPVIVTALGTVVRAADGKVLADWSGMRPESYQVPYWHGDRVYWTMHYSSVVSGRLVMENRDRVAWAPWWLSLNQGLTQMQQCGIYTVGDGQRLCVINPRLGVNTALGPHEAATLDVETGVTRGRRSFVFFDGGWSYMPHVTARDVILFGQYKYAGTPPVEPYHNLAFCTKEDAPRVLVRNEIPLTKAGVVCDGDRVYVRGEREVVCFARLDPAYERRRQAEHLLTETVRARPNPPRESPVEIAPEPGPLPAGVPTWPVQVSTAPGRWLFAGPFVPGQAPLPDPARARLAPGQKLTAGEVTREVVELNPDLVDAVQEGSWYSGKMGYSEANALRVFEAVGKAPSSLAYYYTVLRVTRPCVVKFGLRASAMATFWVGGRQLTGEDTTYRLSPGYYPWLVAVQLDRKQLPPVADFSLGFGLVQVPDLARAVAHWREQTAPYRADLVKVTTEDPDTTEAATARVILEQLEVKDQARP